MLSLGLIATIFHSLGLQRARNMVERMALLSGEQRFEALIAHAPKRFVPLLLKHRYIAIIVALNVPGNAIIGGGGGIALLAGVSGLFTLPRFVASAALATLPVPLAVMLAGS